MRRTKLFTLPILTVLLVAGCSTLKNLDLSDFQPLDEETVAAGLKEALKVGTERTVDQVGVEGGYLDSSLLRIPLPDDVQEVAGTLRTVGLGAKVDELEVAMNRAAELAANEAVDVFAAVITEMTLQDAWGILRGHETAATDYFHEKTASELISRYRPIIETKLRTVGGYQDYEDLVARLQYIPLIDAPDLDLVGYVNGRALDGLFSVLAQEEKRIREDPVARTTTLLQRVFGSKEAAPTS